MTEKSRVYTITELAQEFDVTPRTIRFYEDVGLLQPAREAGRRIYTYRDRTRLKLTLRGKRLGSRSRRSASWCRCTTRRRTPHRSSPPSCRC